MKETLQILIENLVDEPSFVEIKEQINDKTVAYEVYVSEKDIGRVIGREGKMAKSIRIIMKSIAIKKHLKVTIEFMENKRG